MRRTGFAVGFFILLLLFSTARSQTVDWPFYTSDLKGSKYTPADQIDRDNFDRLRVVWRYRPPDQRIYETSGLGHLDMEEHRNTPVAVDGVLYYASPYNILTAIDGETGAEKWVFDPEVWKSRPRFLGNLRGVTYWTDGEVERIFMATSDAALWSVDAKTGQPDPAFGEGGRIDVGASLRRPLTDGDRWNYGITAAPVICRDVVAVGSAIGDWRGEPPEYYTPVGDVQGFDARTGRKVWEFHTIPQAGEFGNETWESDAWKTYGAANVWTSMTADEALGYIYLPISSVSHDYYGGERPGDNLYGESIVCLDAATGERVWHYQMVHHGLWDLDPPAPPILMDVVVGGQPRKIVAQLTKQAFCFVFDRITGEPIWPIEERPVPQSTVEGEKTSPTQPFPTRPAALERQGISEDDLIDFTPELREEAKKILARYDYGPLYAPPTEKGVLVVPGQWGGADWAGGTADPRSGILYVPTHMAITTVQLHRVADPDAFSLYAATNDQHVTGPQGLPLVKPPYGSLTAIDLNTGEHIWRTTVGRGPADHPALKGLDLPDMGWDNRTFALTTPNLLLATSQDPHDLADAGMDYFVDRDAYLRAYDLATGAAIGRVDLPSNAYGAPMSYAAGGRQYVVVPVGNEVNDSPRPSELVALALPREGEVLPPQGRDRGDASHQAYYAAVQAIDAGDAGALRELLAAHPDLVSAQGYFDEWYEYPYFRGASLLHHIAGEPQRAPLPPDPGELAAVLLDAGADPGAATYDSVTVLELVAQSAQLDWAGAKADLIKTLVARGADPNRNRSRMLWVALTGGDAELARMLLAAGARADLRFAAGANRVDLLAQYFDAEGRLKEGVGHLYHPDPDTALTDEQVLGDALNFAAYSGALAAAEYLLDRGADVNAFAGQFQSYDRGSTPLHKTVMMDQLAMARLLVARGADLLQGDKRFNNHPFGWCFYNDTSPELDQFLKEHYEAALAASAP